MANCRGGESLDEVLAVAASRGRKVADAQRYRFHRAGVLPAPRMVGRGRGQGRDACYPLGTGRQLLRLLQLLEADRSLVRARSRLWWEGYAIEDDYMRAPLHGVLDELEPIYEKWASQDEPGFDEEAFWQWFEEYTKGRLPPGPLGRVRRRLGKAKFTTLVGVGLDALTGRNEFWSEEEAAVLAKAVGLPESFVPEIHSAMEPIGQKLSLKCLHQRIDTAHPDELRAARDEVHAIEDVILLVSALLSADTAASPPSTAKSRPAEEPIYLANAAQPFVVTDGRAPLLLLAGWLSMRNVSSLRAAAELFRTAVEALIPSEEGDAGRDIED